MKKNIKFICGSGQNVPQIRSGSQDIVEMHDILGVAKADVPLALIGSRKKTVLEAGRMLKPGGILIISHRTGVSDDVALAKVIDFACRNGFRLKRHGSFEIMFYIGPRKTNVHVLEKIGE